jgi:hypothetical protein
MTWLDVSLDGKLDEGTIFVFFHTTCTKFDKKNKTEEAKHKGRKAQGCIGYLTLNLIIF